MGLSFFMPALFMRFVDGLVKMGRASASLYSGEYYKACQASSASAASLRIKNFVAQREGAVRLAPRRSR